MWPTLLVIIATSITISHGHHGSQHQNIVTTITHQDINTSRVKRFLAGTRYTSYPGKPGYVQNGATGFNRNQNTTQHYVNPVQNYNYSTPGYYPNNGNTNNIKPLYPTPQGYPQYPNNSSGYSVPYAPHNRPAYPVYNTTKPGFLTPVPLLASNSTSVRPAQNNSAAYPANSTKPGYNNAVKHNNMCRRNSTKKAAASIDANVLTMPGDNCPDGFMRIGTRCIDQKYLDDCDEY